MSKKVYCAKLPWSACATSSGGFTVSLNTKNNGSRSNVYCRSLLCCWHHLVNTIEWSDNADFIPLIVVISYTLAMLCYSTVYWLQCLIELIFGMETLLNYNPKTCTLCYKIRICQISRISLYFPKYKRRKFSHGTSIVATCCQRSPTNVNTECDSQSNWCANPVTSIVVDLLPGLCFLCISL